MAEMTMTTERLDRNDWQTIEREFHDAAELIRSDANDEMVDRFCDARKRLLDAPAPDLAALNVKLQALLELDDEEEYIRAWAARMVEQTREDCLRLLSDS